MRNLLTMICLIILTISSGVDASEYNLECKVVHNLMADIYRCENEEVVCYIPNAGHRSGISCKFKEKDNEIDS